MFMRSYKGKIIVRINDYPDIRGCFVGLHMEGLDIKYAVTNTHGTPATSKELLIMNWEPAVGCLFV